MKKRRHNRMESVGKKLLTDYGMILVLVFLIALFSVLTINQEELSGSAAAEVMAKSINLEEGGKNVLIISSTSGGEIEMTQLLEELLEQGGHTVLARVNGDPPQVGAKLRELEELGEVIDVLAVTGNVSGWSLINSASSRFSICAGSEIVQPDSRKFPSFLKRDNLRNIADRISVIAILAI
ncbi:MAG: hypothetical protein OEM26_02790, partial [Saprospiraceae bacterium]|nr:hypothetical protein [Saprospiraceae bacterium]